MPQLDHDHRREHGPERGPRLFRELDHSSTELQRTVDAYALVFAGVLLTAGGRPRATVSAARAPPTAGLVVFGARSGPGPPFATAPVHLVAPRGA